MAMSTEVRKERSIELSPLEWQWIAASLRTQHRVLVRGAQKELPGSEIARLRSSEISALATLMARFV